MCLFSLLCACSAFYVPAQPAVCHNTVEPVVCLLNLLYATIQMSLLCACSGCCVPAQAVVCLLRLLCACSGCCVHAQAAVCHNTVEPAVCLFSLLRAIIQLSLLCACSGCVCMLRLLYACSAYCVPQYS